MDSGHLFIHCCGPPPPQAGIHSPQTKWQRYQIGQEHLFEAIGFHQIHCLSPSSSKILATGRSGQETRQGTSTEEGADSAGEDIEKLFTSPFPPLRVSRWGSVVSMLSGIDFLTHRGIWTWKSELGLHRRRNPTLKTRGGSWGPQPVISHRSRRGLGEA